MIERIPVLDGDVPADAVARSVDVMRAQMLDLRAERDRYRELLGQVYEHAGNHCPAEKRHVLPARLRDEIRDIVHRKGAK